MTADYDKRIRVKICGITDLQDARFVSGALADYIGFIFYEDSPRFIEPSKAGAIINWIEGPECVGVFVNQPLDDVNMVVRQAGIDIVQLHGTESPEYCEMIERPVIKVFHIRPETAADDIEKAITPYRSSVDYLMFDTRVEGKWGGTGKSFDWSLLDTFSGEIPFFLSGGLTPENVHDACETVHPFAVDVSSGVEREPGSKDYDKVEAFMQEMKKIWETQEAGEF